MCHREIQLKKQQTKLTASLRKMLRNIKLGPLMEKYEPMYKTQ